MSQLGRPPKYKGNIKKHIESLIRKHGLTGTRRILNAKVSSRNKNERELAQMRNLELVPAPLGISMPTLGGFAREAGIEVQMGRPRKAA
jgi:hypothetical protein